MQSNQANLPTVAVIIATHNYGRFLDDAIKSCLGQTYPNVEIYVVDDGSTDNTREVVNSLKYESAMALTPFFRPEEVEYYCDYRLERTNLYYIRLKEAGGPSRARNIGIVTAINNACSLFQVLDADDIMYANKIEKLCKPIFMDSQRIAVSYGDYIIKNENEVIRYESKLPYDFITLMNGNCIIHSGSLINGIALQQFLPQPYPEDMRTCEDFALWIKILRSQQWIAVHVPEPLTMVRSHGEDSTNSVNKETWNINFQKALSYRGI